MKKGFAPILIVVIITSVLLTGSYIFIKSKVHPIDWDAEQLTNEDAKNQTTQSPSPNNETVYSDEGAANWKTFMSKDGKNTISYPADWKLTDKSGPSPTSPEYTLTGVEITKNGHGLISYELDAWGPAICTFDKNTVREDGYPTFLMEKYVEFKAGATTYRRTELPEKNDNGLHWTLCESNDGQNFITKGPFGITSYYSPLEYDASLIKTIDQMISTSRFKD